MMKRFSQIVPVLILSCMAGFAQEQRQVTVRLTDRPFAELFDAIENQTGYRIYCTPDVSDSMRVSVNETNVEPVNLIRQALKETPYRTSVFQNAIYIIQDKDLIITLPESFYGKATVDTVSAMPQFERETKAVSESVVYAIGNPNAPASSNVIMRGIVTNFKNGEPIPGATLLLEDPFVGTVTDAFGFYSIQLPPGRRELVIRGIGMKESRRQLMLFSDGKLDIEVEEQIYKLSEVSVVANRIDNVRSVNAGMERLVMQNIKNIPTVMGEADVLRIIMTLPGVKSAGEISSGFNVRGGATDQNLILYNDGTIYMPTHLFGLFSTFNPDLVENMELYKSSIPAKYGGRISSVLDISTKEGNKKAFQGMVSIGLLTSRVTLEGPLFKGKGSYIVGGRTTYSDWLLKKIPEKSGYSNGTAGFYDLNGSVNYKFNENNSLYLTGYYSRDRFNFTGKEEYAYQNANFSAKWRHIFSPKFTGSFVAGYDHYSYNNKDTSDIFNAYQLDYAMNQLFAKADFSYYMNNDHTVNFGVSTLHYRLSPGEYLPADNQSLIRADILQTEKALESAVYLSDEWKISDSWMVSAGIRYSLFNALGPRVYNVYSPDYLPSTETVIRTDTVGGGVFKTYHSPEFRLSLRYIIDDNTSIKAGINSMRQYIHKISNSTVMSPTDTWKLSDANIRPQSGVQVAAGLFRNFAKNTIETSVEAYYKTMKDYLDYRGGAVLLMNPHIETEVAGVKGRAYGAELMIKKTQGKLNGWVSYAYSRTMLRRHEELASSSNTSDWYPTDFDKPHEIKFVGNYKLTHRFSFSLNCDYSTGRPITLPVSKYIYEGQQYVYYTERNKYRIPDFFRLDVSFNIEAGHRLTKTSHSYFTIGVYNLTGRKNAYSVYYAPENNHFQGYQLSIFGAPIPYISYNIRFQKYKK
ncbi:MAG: TonB-dependent receptor [Tannerella sp.]|jgi:outer membrane receptor for ferrienterochelin and colicin|nr:TonB-dependent receptor [Tannerella sp.]